MVKSLVAALVCVLSLAVITHGARRQTALKCGQEYRVVTTDGEELQGRLLFSNGDALSLGDSRTLEIGEIESAYRVHHYGSEGAILGLLSGAIMGGLVGNSIARDSIRTFTMGEKPALTIIGVLTGAGVGYMVGLIIGRSISSSARVDLELLPSCTPGWTTESSLRLHLAWTF